MFEADIDEGGKLLDSMASDSLKSNPAIIKDDRRVTSSLQHEQHFAEVLKNSDGFSPLRLSAVFFKTSCQSQKPRRLLGKAVILRYKVGV